MSYNPSIKQLAPLLSCLVAGLFISCTTASQPIAIDKLYARNVQLEVNGQKIGSSSVVSESKSYKIKMKFPSDIDFLLIRTCHREIAKRPKDNVADFIYEPLSVETSQACPLWITGVEKDHNQRAFGFIDFESERHKLPGDESCNGRTSSFRGVATCESGAGLFQEIRFSTPVDWESVDPGCKVMASSDLKKFRFKVPRGTCTFLFYEIAMPNRTARLTTYGYDEILTVIE